MKKKVILISFALIIILIFSFVCTTFFIVKNQSAEKCVTDEILFKNARHIGGINYYALSDGEYELLYSCGEASYKSWCNYGYIGENLINAFVSSEDREFFNHSGVNYKRTVFALFNYLFKFKSKFGASTITQQVIKNISGDNEQSVKRKLNEIIRSQNLEKNHTKEEILELYLNIIPMGNNLFGVKSAANEYFNKEPSELTVYEAATLAAITNSPTRYNPYKNPEACKDKRNKVLYAMRDNGKISNEEYFNAINNDLKLTASSKSTTVASWFCETAYEEVLSDLMKEKSITKSAARLLLNGGCNVYMTMDKDVQRILEEYFEDEFTSINNVNNKLNLGFAIYDSNTGDLKGIIGNSGKKTANKIINYAKVPVRVGSALKPIALYAPLIDQKKINYSTVFDDVPQNITEKDGAYSSYPHNSPDRYEGLLTVKDALRYSKNTVAYRMYNLLGKDYIFEHLTNEYGINTLVRARKTENGATLTDLDASPLALGQLTDGISISKLTHCYTVFPNDGVLNNEKSYLYVTDIDGNIIINKKKFTNKVLDSSTSRIMNQLLSSVTDNGTAKDVGLKYFVDTAGKTGTSGSSRDKIFVGFTPYYTAGIWCGGAGESLNMTNEHIKAWDDVMTAIHNLKLTNDNVEGFSTDGLIRAEYCKDSGMVPTDACHNDERGSRIELGYFTYDNIPNYECELHLDCYIDDEGVITLFERENTRLISKLNYKRNLPEEFIVKDSDALYFASEYEINAKEDKKAPKSLLKIIKNLLFGD